MRFVTKVPSGAGESDAIASNRSTTSAYKARARSDTLSTAALSTAALSTAALSTAKTKVSASCVQRQPSRKGARAPRKGARQGPGRAKGADCFLNRYTQLGSSCV
jgi:hypothetical protein